MKITAFFDGCCEPKNPGGNMGFGAIIYTDGVVSKKLSSCYKSRPENSNNVAEYQSFGWVVKSICEFALNGDEIEIFGDSKLVVEQMNGRWKIKDGLYSSHAKKAKQFVDILKSKCKLSIKYIPRDQNDTADKLSKEPLLKSGVKFRLQKVN